MRKFIFALIFIFGIISCEKYDTLPEPYVDPDVIENFTYDEDGVVYQLINDLDSIIYEMSYDTTIFVVFDSILVIKFHIPFLSHQYDSAYKYTSFLKFGQKANWRYLNDDYTLSFICYGNKCFEYHTYLNAFENPGDTIKIKCSKYLKFY